MFAVFATPGRPFGRTLRARVPAPLATVTTTPPPLRVFAEVVEHRVTFDIVFFPTHPHPVLGLKKGKADWKRRCFV